VEGIELALDTNSEEAEDHKHQSYLGADKGKEKVGSQKNVCDTLEEQPREMMVVGCGYSLMVQNANPKCADEAVVVMHMVVVLRMEVVGKGNKEHCIDWLEEVGMALNWEVYKELGMGKGMGTDRKGMDNEDRDYPLSVTHISY
jgi:hypothetical protein